jgi:hypothetical protein
MRVGRKARKTSGRLLSEFLVSLGLLFLILTANLTILNSASQSSSQAGATREALELAQEGMEEVIASPPKPGLSETSFGSKSRSVEGFTFTRKIKVTALTGEQQGLLEALVTVDWGRGRTVRLERYVSKL